MPFTDKVINTLDNGSRLVELALLEANVQDPEELAYHERFREEVTQDHDPNGIDKAQGLFIDAANLLLMALQEAYRRHRQPEY